MKKLILTLIIPALTIMSCKLDDAEYISVEELFLPDSELAAPSGGGTVSYRIYSSSSVSLIPEDGIPEWATVEDISLVQDGILVVTLKPNDGFRRGFVLNVKLDGKDVTRKMIVKQEGIVPSIECDMTYKYVTGSENSSAFYDIKTNIDPNLLQMRANYFGSDRWIDDIGVDDRSVVVATKANTEPISRQCSIDISYIDGWQEEHGIHLLLTQSSSSGQFGTPITFAAARGLASEKGESISGDFTLNGIVISDSKSPNMEENPCLTLDVAGDMKNTNVSESVRSDMRQVVDTTASARTAYIEAEDGTMGFRIVFDNAADNTLPFGAKITLSLSGCRIERESNPVRYTVKGVQARNIYELKSGANVPVKERTISSLSDDDLFTYVSIKNVEFPVKEGSYTDIRENHALWSEVNDNTVSKTDGKRYFCLDGYATSVLDNDGKSICLPINMLCRWRKPAKGIPSGNGPINGILVSNVIQRYGNAGKYQLRVIDEKGFEGLSGKSVWKKIAGWDMGSASASYGKGNAVCEKKNSSLSSQRSYKSTTAATGKTCGISDTYKALNVNSDIRGWYNWGESGEVSSIDGLVLHVSTSGISGSIIAVIFRFYAGSTGTPSSYQAFPAHWCVDYSIDGEEYKPAVNSDLSGKDYVHLRGIAYYTNTFGSFTIPVTTSNTLGPTQHVFCLPSEAFGRTDLAIRIRPYDTVISTVPTLFYGECETSDVTPNTVATDYVSFQDIFINYR